MKNNLNKTEGENKMENDKKAEIMDYEEKIQSVQEAQDLLFQALEILEEVIEDDGHAKAYLLDQLKTLVSNDHGMLCSDFNCDKLIEQYRENIEELEDEIDMEMYEDEDNKCSECGSEDVGKASETDSSMVCRNCGARQ